MYQENVRKKGQSRDTGNIGHKKQKEDKHNKTHRQQIYNDVQLEPHHLLED
jgi:hypothetical protein